LLAPQSRSPVANLSDGTSLSKTVSRDDAIKLQGETSKQSRLSVKRFGPRFGPNFQDHRAEALLDGRLDQQANAGLVDGGKEHPHQFMRNKKPPRLPGTALLIH
jgi:hypothetical protein